MSTQTPDAARRIFPRNLTARAAYVVRGNPASARPESGVENTHPGLEYDQRNLDKHFFPGITIEFQFLDGARVTAIDPGLLPPGLDLRAEDAGGELRLLYAYGRFGIAPDVFALRELGGQDGYDVLRQLRDLEDDQLLVVIGRPLSAGEAPDGGIVPAYLALLQALQRPGKDFAVNPQALPPVARDARGQLLLAAIAGRRARFVASDGVLDPAIVPPGELTRSLCAPWQWDFADCGCHYWASSRPDIVVGQEGGPQTLNFQRNRSEAPPLQPATTYEAWIEGEVSQQAMITTWQNLPIVINERETDRFTPPPRPRPHAPMQLMEIIEELIYLATVEHALCVNYLYAHYSINAPARLPDDADAAARARFAAAREVFLIAVDEMRHLRWANEALAALKAPQSFGRADHFVLHDRAGDRKVPFTIAPLTHAVLDFFIEVEAPSRNWQDDDIDGMYTRILVSLQQLTTIPSETIHKVSQLIKLIIDEGHGHWERFQKVRELIGGLPEAAYLRLGAPCPAAGGAAEQQDLCDLYYNDLLSGIAAAFDQSFALREDVLEQAHRTMQNLHELAHYMAARGVTPLFRLGAAGDLAAALQRLSEHADPGMRAMGQRHAAAVIDQRIALQRLTAAQPGLPPG